MPFTFTDGSATIGTTEYSIPSASTTRVAQTSIGYVGSLIDFSLMTASETYRIRGYEKINGTQKLVFDATISGVQAQAYEVAPRMWGSGWDITVTRVTTTSGADKVITFSWRIDTGGGSTPLTAAQTANAVWDEARSGHVTAGTFGQGAASVQGNVTGSVNSVTSTVGSVTGAVGSVATGGIVAASFAASAINAAAIATDAITAAKVAADAVAEIQTGLATSTALGTAQTDLTTLTGRLTAPRATALDNLDAAITTRAAAATAVSNVNYTSGRATLIDNLDVVVSTRASASSLSTVAGNVTTIAAGVVSVLADTDDIQTRIPTALDAGNIKASVQTVTAGAVTSIAVGVMVSVVETGITVTGALRLLLSEAVGRVSGFLTNAPVFRDALNTKNRITATTTTDGRTSVTLDAT